MNPLLTIAIPTFQRAQYLQLNLHELRRQFTPALAGELEIIVSDNASPDETRRVVDNAIAQGLPVHYIRNASNLGSDENIAQCFNVARGAYVLILGDDDVLVDDALVKILDLLRPRKAGVLALRAFGYEQDFRIEHPGGAHRGVQSFHKAEEFITRLGVFSTLISANIIGKYLLEGVDARAFCGTHLVQTHLVYTAVLRSRENIYVDEYLVACKRNNSGRYPFSDVFVDQFGRILDGLIASGVDGRAVSKVEQQMLVGFYPFYIWRLRRSRVADLAHLWRCFSARFGRRAAFWVFVAPVIKLPRSIAIVWGALATAGGRAVTGDFQRGLSYAFNRLRLHWRLRHS